MAALSLAGGKKPLTEGCGLGHAPLCPAALGKAVTYAQRLQARVSGVKAKCFSPCQPQEERRKHHLSAGADSVGDCSGLPLRFKMEMA